MWGRGDGLAVSSRPAAENTAELAATMLWDDQLMAADMWQHQTLI